MNNLDNLLTTLEAKFGDAQAADVETTELENAIDEMLASAGRGEKVLSLSVDPDEDMTASAVLNHVYSILTATDTTKDLGDMLSWDGVFDIELEDRHMIEPISNNWMEADQ